MLTQAQELISLPWCAPNLTLGKGTLRLGSRVQVVTRDASYSTPSGDEARLDPLVQQELIRPDT